MDSAVSSAAEAAFAHHAAPPAFTVADVQRQFKDWLEAFTGETLTGDESVIANVAGLIATAEPEALDLLGERLHELLADMADAAEETGEDISEDYFAAIEGVISAIGERLPAVDADDVSDDADAFEV